MPKILGQPPPGPVVGPQGDPIDAPPVERTTTITLLSTKLFPSPLPMGAAGNAVVVLPGFSISPNQGSVLSSQLTLAVVEQMLADWKAGLAQAAVALFTNNIVPAPSLTWASITEPTGTWYAEVDTTLGPLIIFPDGNLGYVGSSAQWNYTGSSPSQNIVGWALVNVVTS